jgi:hypothetical protein
MSGGLSFHETMTGPVALGAQDPDEGTNSPNASPLSIQCHIMIDDLDRFVADPEHVGAIQGSIEYGPFGGELPVKGGIFNLFKKEDAQRVMEYRLPFEQDGKRYLLAGRKHVRDEHGVDVWKDTTTLYTRVHEGPDESGPVAAAGVLTIGVEALARMTGSMRPTGGGGIESLAKFGRFFMGELWETYGKTKLS